MADGRRERIATELMAALLSNPHFSAHHLKALHHQKVLNKTNDYFRLMAVYARIGTDLLLSELEKKK